MTIHRVTQLELEEFISVNEIATDPEAGTGVTPLSAGEVRKRSLAARQTLDEQLEAGETADWAEVYHNLINAGWPWRIAAWVAWSTLPKNQRWPNTQHEIATEVLGLHSDRVIATWRKKYPTLDQMIADLQADEMLEARADVFRALKISASTPDYKHSPDRRLYLTMSGDYIEHSKIDLGKRKAKDNLRDLSDAELDALSGDPAKIRALLDELRSEEPDGDLED